MFEWLTNFGQWLSDIIDPLIVFFKSLIHGFQTLITTFPKIFNITTTAITYLPSIFAVFVSITIIVYIVYLIVGRNAGGSD